MFCVDLWLYVICLKKCLRTVWIKKNLSKFLIDVLRGHLDCFKTTLLVILWPVCGRFCVLIFGCV